MAINPVAPPIDLNNLEVHFHLKPALALSALSGIAHACVADYFFINPLSGLCYGVAHAISIWAINALFRIGNINTNRAGGWMMRYSLCMYGAPAIAALISTAMGFPMDYATGYGLNILTAFFIIRGVFYTALASFAVATVAASIAIIHRMRRDHVTVREAIIGLYNDLRPRLPERIRIPLDNLIQQLGRPPQLAAEPPPHLEAFRALDRWKPRI